jgi:glutaredoxin-like YruB-family protein
MKNVISFEELKERTSIAQKCFLLLYKQGSDLSTCALENLKKAVPDGTGEIEVLLADVTSVRDIHGHYGISSVPSFVQFEHGKLVNVFKGCQDSKYYRLITENAILQANAMASGRPQKSVRVYSTPTCSWCNTLKTWLSRNGIPYTDIDVSRDEKAAQDLVRRSGQQGVPQTEINGQIVVGFNQQRLKELLEIQ